MPSVRFDHPSLLADPNALATLLGPIAEIERAPMMAPGFSGARFEWVRVRHADGRSRSLVLKLADLATDWTAWRTGADSGRMRLVLEDDNFSGIWQEYACPYLAHAVAGDEVGLLMDDLTPHLFPDRREPLDEAAQETLVNRMARLHARFWDAPPLADGRLATADRLLGMLGPQLSREVADRSDLPPVIQRACLGWDAARRRLPARVSARLWQTPGDIMRSWDLPATLVHGDAKVANFALLPDGRVAAFDWGCVAAAPAALDIGWYLAVNATRIRGTKETWLAQYRGRLETALGRAVPATTWSGLERAAFESGAMMLLWSKALAFERADDGAATEWNWWVARLDAT